MASSYENSIQVVLAEVRERLANVPSDEAELKSGLLELEGLLHEALRNGKSVRQEMERRILDSLNDVAGRVEFSPGLQR